MNIIPKNTASNKNRSKPTINNSRFDIISETITYSGKIFEIVQQKRNIEGKQITFEIARRSPGTRLLILRTIKNEKSKKQEQLLLTKEYRRELNKYDYRLPGGKVFDTLLEYKNAIKTKEDLLLFATNAAKKECLEETGLDAKTLDLYKISKAGATIEWDLYYFIVKEFSKSKQNLEIGEDITLEWKSFDEVKLLCREGEINEDRSVGVILNFLNK
ncbi:MAG: NUDIX domain-containing protein [Candidatus Woesearchaeota archaeon]|jgi:8-oxo-dGTP pyrophosphatase MutT (NUDIX family)